MKKMGLSCQKSQVQDWLDSACIFPYTFNTTVCGFFINVLSIPDCVVSNGGMTVHNELERMWKEAVMA
jgi:hypothetical protein